MNAIVCVNSDWETTRWTDNRQIFDVKEDKEMFKELTKGGIIIMGRRTYEDIGEPLPNRINVVVTESPRKLLFKQEHVYEDLSSKSGPLYATTMQSLYYILHKLKIKYSIPEYNVWCIGGKMLYKALIPQCDKVVVSMIEYTEQDDDNTPSGDKMIQRLDANTLRDDWDCIDTKTIKDCIDRYSNLKCHIHVKTYEHITFESVLCDNESYHDAIKVERKVEDEITKLISENYTDMYFALKMNREHFGGPGSVLKVYEPRTTLFNDDRELQIDLRAQIVDKD